MRSAKYELIKFEDMVALYSKTTISADMIDGLYVYNFRRKGNQLETLEKRVVVNGGGALLLPFELVDLEELGIRYVVKDSLVFLHRKLTIKEYKVEILGVRGEVCNVNKCKRSSV